MGVGSMGLPTTVVAGLGLAIIAMVLSGAMQTNWRDLAEAFRSPAWLARALVAVNIVVPLAALVACLLLPIAPSVAAAILIMAISPLAPPISMKLMKSGADASRIEAHFVLLTLLSVILVPLSLSGLSPLLGLELQIGFAAVLQAAIMLVLVPVAIGATFGSFAPALAAKAVQALAKLAYVLLLVLVPLVLVIQGRPMLQLLGDGSLLAMCVVSVAALAGGHLLGRNPRERELFATAAVVRNPGIALMAVTANALPAPAVTAVFLFLLVNLVASALYNIWTRRTGQAAAVAA